jgi:hypothetical protein
MLILRMQQQHIHKLACHVLLFFQHKLIQIFRIDIDVRNGCCSQVLLVQMIHLFQFTILCET